MPICNGVRNHGRSRSSKVIDFGANQKRVCNFLLVINSNLGPLLLHFREIVGFLLRTATPFLFLSGAPLLPLEQIAGVGALWSEDPKEIV